LMCIVWNFQLQDSLSVSLSLSILISIPTHRATFHRLGDIDTQLIFRQRLQAGSSKFSMSFSSSLMFMVWSLGDSSDPLQDA
jgi:hypothetical protein